MAILLEKFSIISKGFNDVIDITQYVSNIVSNFNVQNAMVNISALSSYVSIITIEDESGIAYDISKMLEIIAPINRVYQHDNIWHEGNAYSHLRASILGNDITLPVSDGKVMLDELRKIILIDFDNKSANRNIVVTVIY